MPANLVFSLVSDGTLVDVAGAGRGFTRRLEPDHQAADQKRGMCISGRMTLGNQRASGLPDRDLCFDVSSGQHHIGCGSLALAAVARFFTQKSRAALLFACKTIIIRLLPCPAKYSIPIARSTQSIARSFSRNLYPQRELRTIRFSSLPNRCSSPNGRVGWRWLVWHRFPRKNRTRLPSRLQLQDSKRRVRASGIFDSHRPLHFQPAPANASQ